MQQMVAFWDGLLIGLRPSRLQGIRYSVCDRCAMVQIAGGDEWNNNY